MCGISPNQCSMHIIIVVRKPWLGSDINLDILGIKADLEGRT